jgi:hypothetical protein
VPVALFFGLALLSLRGRVKALTVLVLLANGSAVKAAATTKLKRATNARRTRMN